MHEQGSAARQPTNLGRIPPEALASESLVPVLVEFHEPPLVVWRARHPLATAAQAQSYQQSLQASHRGFVRQMNGHGVTCKVSSGRALESCHDGHNEVVIDHDFTYLFNGLGLLVSGSRVVELAGIPGVKQVTGNHEHPYLTRSNSIPFIGAPAVWQRQDPDGLPCDGTGVTIAVIDTGVDQTHPAFGGFKAVPNAKIVHAVSYTGEPQQDNFGHGSHCAGIAAGDLYKGTPRGDSLIQGVAPKAQLMSYKVLSAMGGGTAAAIVSAIEDAVLRGAHVLNLSLGDTSGDPTSPEAITCNNAMLAGAVVCCAAGNSGPGAGTVGSPGSADLVLTVGASTDDAVVATYARTVGAPKPREMETRLLHGSAALPEPALQLHYVACGLGRDPSDFPTYAYGRIALIQRGAVSFRQKARSAEIAGCAAAVIVNNGPGNFWGTLGEASADDPQPKIPVVSISQADGEYLHRLGRDGLGVSLLSLLLDPKKVPMPDRLAEFSSRGPSRNFSIKPELCAPGVNIYSATILAGPFPGVPDLSKVAV